MDNTGNSHLAGNDADKPIPFDDGPGKQAPQNTPAGVSRAPLNLGGGASPPPPPAKNMPKITTSTPIHSQASQQITSSDRITGVKTFFTKLHPGALEFLDDLVNDWLKDHPEVRIKHTNVTTGEVQAKKTEPNIIICVWY